MVLSISLMVSNSIDTIRKCMESLKPLLDNLDSELIVVDTGGTDGSIDIAREYATKVVMFEWCKDFAKARNAGLLEAQGEWFMWLDDDEWFEDVTEIIDFFKSGEYRDYGCATYLIRNYFNEEGTTWRESSRTGLFRRDPDVIFVRPIHEHVNRRISPEKAFNCYEHHYGYVSSGKNKAEEHSARNRELLLQEINKNPNDHHYILQLVQEYMFVGDYDTALNYALGGVRKLSHKTFAEIKQISWLAEAVVKCCLILQRKDDAYAYAKKYTNTDWILELYKAAICLLISKDAKLTGNMDGFEFFFPKFEEYVEWLLVNPDDLVEQDVFGGEGVEKPAALIDGYCLMITYLCEHEKYDEADEYGKKLIKKSCDFIEDLRKRGINDETLVKFYDKNPEFTYGLKLRSIFKEDVSEEQKRKLLLEMQELLPEMDIYTKYLMGKLTPVENPEFVQLAKQVKNVVNQLIESGDLEAAKQTLVQLERLIPNDPEIILFKKVLDGECVLEDLE